MRPTLRLLSDSLIEQVLAEGMPLSSLPDGRQGEVLEIDSSCQGFTRRRFMDLGLTPGARVSPELSNAFGDPRAYRIRGTLIALRKDQAALVVVKPLAAETRS